MVTPDALAGSVPVVDRDLNFHRQRLSAALSR